MKELEQIMTVKISKTTFYVSTFVFERCGNTDNMKFKVSCSDSDYPSMEFDDLAGVNDYLSRFFYNKVDELLL